MAQTLQVADVPDELVQKLEARLRETGEDRTAYVVGLLRRDLQSPSLDALLAPFRRQVEASGLSEEELADVFEEARDDVSRMRTQA